ncbi:MAG: Rne/Rng family ribonuclease, partial [Pseudomonadota bacterium]
MAKKMLIDATHPEETRVVVADGNKVDDFDFESINKRQLAGNIYLAKVTRVEPSLQAAFVEYGGNRHGFLAFSEIHPDYYQIPVADREALLAEEAREEEARRAREEENENAEPKKGRGRGRRKKDKKNEETASSATDSDDTAAPTAEAAAVAGLEVIDVIAEDVSGDLPSDAPRGLEIAVTDTSDPEPGDPLVAVEPAGAEETADAVTAEDADPDDTTEASVDLDGDAEAPAEDTEVADASDAVTGTQPEDAVAEAAPDEASNADGQIEAGDASAEVDHAEEEVEVSDDTAADVIEEPEDPKTIAESAGLDDEDSVSEPVPDAATRRPTPDAAADEPVADGSGEADTMAADAEPADGDAAKAAEAETAAPEADDAAAAEAEAPAENATEDSAETAESGSDASDASGEATDGSGEEAGEAEEKPARSRRSRGRRGRGRKGGKDAAEENGGKDAEVKADRENGDGANGDEGDDKGVDAPDEVGAEDTLEEAAEARTRLRRRYKIQDVIKVRQILLVQVVKEERGNKGAALTTYLSLAGRYCVLMPNTARGGGISRKITNAGDRKRLREITGGLEVPQGMGLIVRTAGAERTKAEIKRDYEYLLRQWEQIRDLTLKSIAPTLIYEEGSLIKRSIRDIYNKDIDQVLVEGENGYREAKEYMKMLMPSHAKNVQPYADPIPLFSRYQVESYLNGMFNPTVQLKSGGYIVIGVTEALVAIDVNSGRATKQGSIEETALQTNLEAADEVARQLRLRDLAGLIVIDFIDMDENRNNRAIEKRMKDRLKNDRARIQIGRISAFGLMEMSRQRLRPGMLEATTQPCPACHGTGLIRSDESLSLSILREIEEEGLRGRADQLEVRVPVDVSNYLINTKRQHLAQIEERHSIAVSVLADPSLRSPEFEVERSKSSGPRRPQRQQAVVTAGSVVSDEDPVAEEVRDDLEDGKARRRRGKRGGRRKRGEQPEVEAQDVEADSSTESEDAPQADDASDDKPRSRKRGGRRRGGKGRRKDEAAEDQSEGQSQELAADDQADAAVADDEVT